MDQEKVESLATTGVNVSQSVMIGIGILGFLKNPNIKLPHTIQLFHFLMLYERSLSWHTPMASAHPWLQCTVHSSSDVEQLSISCSQTGLGDLLSSGSCSICEWIKRAWCIFTTEPAIFSHEEG